MVPSADHGAGHWPDRLDRIVAAIGSGDVFSKGRDFGVLNTIVRSQKILEGTFKIFEAFH